MADKLTHISEQGDAQMVDVSTKPDQLRIARASGTISMKPATVTLVKEGTIKKGDVLAVARIAAIQAAKKTGDIIPLCHPLPLTHIGVEINDNDEGFTVVCESRTVGKTGVEMEALTGVSAALLTIYDMCKGVDKEMTINNIYLIEKIKK